MRVYDLRWVFKRSEEDLGRRMAMRVYDFSNLRDVKPDDLPDLGHASL